VLTLPDARPRGAFPGVLPWTHGARCRGRTHLFFPQLRERPERRARREAEARAICNVCPVLELCRRWARENREYGFWGGESEEERAAAGYRAAISSGVTAPLDWDVPEATREAS
jgi:WhiB family redox-sensing transcriptional regulator